VRGEATDAAYDRLLAIARSLGPDAQLPPVRNLLQEFGVSRATLDAALRRLERQRIVYRRERSGVFVAPAPPRQNICLICSPSYVNSGAPPFWGLLIDDIRRYAEESGFGFSMGMTNEPITPEWLANAAPPAEDGSLLPDWLLADLDAGKINGVLLVGVRKGPARWLESQGIPVVAYAGPARYVLHHSTEELIRDGVRALVQRGRRRICLLSWPEVDWPGMCGGAKEAFEATLAEQGLPISGEGKSSVLDMNSFAGSRGYTGSNVERGFDAGLRLFGPDTDPNAWSDAILSVNDMMTQGLLMRLGMLGITLDGRFDIATHSNAGSSVLLGWQHQLVRIEYSLRDMVQCMFLLLGALIEGGDAFSRMPLETLPGMDLPLLERAWVLRSRVILPEPELP